MNIHHSRVAEEVGVSDGVSEWSTYVGNVDGVGNVVDVDVVSDRDSQKLLGKNAAGAIAVTERRGRQL
jgi:hypothetical protein